MSVDQDVKSVGCCPSVAGAHLPRFYIYRAFKLPWHDQYKVIVSAEDGGGNHSLVAFAEKMKLKSANEFTFFTDESKEVLLFSHKPDRSRREMAVIDATGAQLAVMSYASIWQPLIPRPTWNLRYAGVEGTGKVRSSSVGEIMRLVGALNPPYDMDFVDELTGKTVLRVSRWSCGKAGDGPDCKRFKPYCIYHYMVNVPDARLDFRVATAVAVVAGNQ